MYFVAFYFGPFGMPHLAGAKENKRGKAQRETNNRAWI
jgi:hypothetical protein